MSDSVKELYTDTISVEDICFDPAMTGMYVRKPDTVNHPPHYTKGRFETIDVLEDIIQFYRNPVLASQVWQVMKYLSRAPHKGKLLEDLEKARWYLERAIRTTQALESDRESD